MRYTTTVFKEFKKFILRGNLVDLAVGFTVGASFSTVAKSLVTDIIMPPIGYLLGNADFTNLFWVIRPGNPGGPYNTLEAANTAGAITVNYGMFFNNILSLLLVAVAMFVVIHLFNQLNTQLEDIGLTKQKGQEEPTSKKCPHCIQTIPYRATRCPNCTSKLQPQKSQKD